MLVDALRRRVRTRSHVCRAERLDWLMAGGPWVARVENDGESGGGPTVRRMLLGAQLRRLREAKGVSREEAGYLIRGSESKISRIELGRVGFKERDVADLLTLYGVVEEAERTALLTLASEANKPGWWQPYGDLLPTWLQIYLDLEAAEPEEIDRRVSLRMARKRLLTRPDARQLWAVIDEAVLRRPIGGVEVLQEQIG